MKRICINPDCEWVGDENECLDFKHPIGARLCPECHETTEEITETEARRLAKGTTWTVISKAAKN